jgi:hypothetical protein
VCPQLQPFTAATLTVAPKTKASAKKTLKTRLTITAVSTFQILNRGGYRRYEGEIENKMLFWAVFSLLTSREINLFRCVLFV